MTNSNLDKKCQRNVDSRLDESTGKLYASNKKSKKPQSMVNQTLPSYTKYDT